MKIICLLFFSHTAIKAQHVYTKPTKESRNDTNNGTSQTKCVKRIARYFDRTFKKTSKKIKQVAAVTGTFDQPSSDKPYLLTWNSPSYGALVQNTCGTTNFEKFINSLSKCGATEQMSVLYCIFENVKMNVLEEIHSHNEHKKERNGDEGKEWKEILESKLFTTALTMKRDREDQHVNT